MLSREAVKNALNVREQWMNPSFLIELYRCTNVDIHLEVH